MTYRILRMPALLAGTALLLAACGSGFESSSAASVAPGSEDPGESTAASEAAEPGADLTILIGSSGDAETDIVNELVAEWSAESGVNAEVVVASDLNQQLAQGFSSNEPPDLFYLSTDQMAVYAATDSLEPYAESLSNADAFYPGLREAFTYNDQFMCAPKDFSTLALIINSDMWADAGLTDDDIPTTWDELNAVAEQLTTDERRRSCLRAGGPARRRIHGCRPAARSSPRTERPPWSTRRRTLEALQYVKDQMAAGSFAYSNDARIDAGWGGEAFGIGKAAMVIEGNWIAGAMTNDFPDVNYVVAELPEGPAGPARSSTRTAGAWPRCRTTSPARRRWSST